MLQVAAPVTAWIFGNGEPPPHGGGYMKKDLIGKCFLSEKIRMYHGGTEQMSFLEFNPIGFAIGLNSSKGVLGAEWRMRW